VWYLRLSSGGTLSPQWGLNGDTPLAADFDGDGRAELAVFRPASGVWYVLDPFTGAVPAPVQWGLAGDLPLAQDFDGDGLADRAVFRPSSGTWYLRLSTGVTRAVQWGLPGDVPLLIGR